VEKLELGEATTQKLISAGIETVQELLAMPLEKLTEIPGVGEKTAEKLIAVANEYVAAHPPTELVIPAAELEFTPEMEAAPETAGAAQPVSPGDSPAPPDAETTVDATVQTTASPAETD